MASVKAVLFTSKTLKNGEHPIMIRFIVDRKPKYISIGYSCSKDLWDKKNNCPKNKHPHKVALDIIIDKKKTEANQILLELQNEDKEASLDEIEKHYNRSTKKITVFKYINQLIDRLNNIGKTGTAESYKDLKRSLVKFRGGKDMAFSDIDYLFLKHFEEDFLARGVQESSISVYMRALRSIFNKAITEDYCHEKYYPFKKYKISRLNTKSRKRALTKDQIKDILDLPLEPGTSLYNTRAYFMFSFYNMGMNFKDISYLRCSDIQNDRIQYQRKKTKKHYNIKILDPVQEILDYFRAKYPNDGNYVFPVLGQRHTSLKSQNNRIKKVLKEVNRNLKEIAKLAGIGTEMTFYVARHSWATIMKRSGESTAVISEGLGHDNEKTTQIYLDSFENSVLDEANKRLLDWC